MAHAQGFMSNVSVGVGFEGIFPAATFTKSAAEVSSTSASTQDTTKSVGVIADARYEFGHHSALDFSFTLNRNSEIYEDPNQNLSRVQTNNAELIGSYIFRLPSNEKVKPYALLGGGMIRFSPNNNFTTGLTPSTETKPAFAYGFGSDFKLSERWAVRVQYRGLVRSDPDFKLSGSFGTALKANVAEPSAELVYHF